MRIAARVAALVAGLLIVLGSPASAHPLGNFTINHYAGLALRLDGVSIDFVLDLSEIPTFQLGDTIAADPSAACGTFAGSLALAFDGRPVPLRVDRAVASMAAGQGGLATLRVECALAAAWRIDAGSHQVDFADATYPDRIGWREITARGEDVVLEASVARESASGRLTAYPQLPLASAPDVRSTRIRVSLGTSSTLPTPTVPALIAPARDVLGTLLDGDLGTLPLLAALALAAGIGALHAATPGHGKTIMAAYLVGTRRSSRDALVLALIVAASHTLGVLVLACVVLVGAASFPADRVYPVASAASAIIVVAIGLDMLRRELAHRSAHSHHHSHDHVSRSRTPSLFALGVAGGLVPSASALVLLLAAIAAHHAELGLLLVVAFGIGMSVTLVGVGLALVWLGASFARAQIGRRFAALFPLAASLAVLVLGIALATQSLASLV